MATKPANNMTYDGRALVARPLSNLVKNSRLVLVTPGGRSMSAMAMEFAEHCRVLFGVGQSDSEGQGKAPLRQYAPGDSQS
jgi:hypothetical protein